MGTMKVWAYGCTRFVAFARHDGLKEPTMQRPWAIPSGTFDVGGGPTVHRLGFGALDAAGAAAWDEAYRR